MGKEIMGEQTSGELYIKIGDSYMPFLEIKEVEPEVNLEYDPTISLNQELISSFQMKTRVIPHHRKTFKKYLMSIGYKRNEAEACCNHIKMCKGLFSYKDYSSNIFLPIFLYHLVKGEKE